MTERKPADMTVESWVDRQIRSAVERGELDGLAGAGRPIPPSPADDESGWVRRKLQEEGLPTDALLPMSLQLRREIDRLPRTLAAIAPWAAGAEAEARGLIADLNRRIAAWMRAPAPPLLPIAPIDADSALARWRSAAAAAAARDRAERAGPPPPADDETVSTRRTPTMDAPGSEPSAHRSDPRGVTVYWRPGCVYCLRLRLILRLRRLHPTMIDIHRDADAAAFVRSVADGNETVPTVVIDGVAHVNPAPRLVVAALRR